MHYKNNWIIAISLITLTSPSAFALGRGSYSAQGLNIVGSEKTDFLFGSRRDDTLDGRGGVDLMLGRGGDDELLGGSGDDLLFGQEGEDTLRGEKGNDRLRGGPGADLTSGGPGADLFIYDGDAFDGTDVSAPGRSIVGGEDTIPDFEVALDIFGLDAKDFGVKASLSFLSLDATISGATVPSGSNVIVLLNSDSDSDPATPFLAGTAANQIAAITTGDRPGFSSISTRTFSSTVWCSRRTWPIIPRI